jgi:DNA ligase (NAD+)
MQELKLLEEKYPQFESAESPTQRCRPGLCFRGCRAPAALAITGQRIYDEDLFAWYNRVVKLAGSQKFGLACEHKMDGLAIALTYVDGRLTTGATRGDGFHGENITRNLRTIRSIPLIVPDSAPPRFEVRGEVYLPKAGLPG